MNTLTFANPWGFLALLGVPAVLAIHFLQRESRRVVTSTLFLLEQLAPVSAQGRRIERLRNSIPLWLQLLAVLLLAWLLAQPRWLRRDSTQRVVIVLDSSVSMTAFREPMLRAIHDRLTTLSHAAAHNDWTLLESDTSRGTLYSGTDLNALFAALEKWHPHLGSHDIMPALRVAQSLLRGSGAIIFVTDRHATVPDDVDVLAVGELFDNCGFAGLRIDTSDGRPVWRVLVKNYGATPQKRLWWIEANGEKIAPQQIVLEPGQSHELEGLFPSNAEKCELVLSGDRFTLDDRMPIIRSQPKRLKIFAEKNEATDAFFGRFLGSVESIDRVASGADVQLLTLDPGAPRASSGHAVFFFLQPDETEKYLAGPTVAETHPLTAELNWQGLVCKETRSIEPHPRDEVLLWQGGRALIFLRGDGPDRSLVVNFDLRRSNADRLPAFVILLHRFVETIRAAKISVESENVETNQLLAVASDPVEPKPRVVGATQSAAILRAPSEPGFFEIAQNDTTLLKAAAHFADAREADFRDAAAFDTLQNKAAKFVEKNSSRDFLAPLWTLILGVVCFANWSFTGKNN